MLKHLAAILVMCAPVAALAQEDPNAPGAEIPSLFNPTPEVDWRALSADRPDFTESPYTVDAGAVQWELSFFEYAKDGDSEAWSVAPSNIKLGLLDDVDIQFVLAPYTTIDDDVEGTTDGFGDTQVRLKINLWGNDEGKTALAIMPFVDIPTAAPGLGNDHVEGGVILPYAMSLTDRLGLGLMLEADFVYDDAADNYETELLATAALGYDVSDEVGVYAEIIGSTRADGGSPNVGILGLGGTYLLERNVQLDAGVNIGLTEDAEELGIFSGLTFRF